MAQPISVVGPNHHLDPLPADIFEEDLEDNHLDELTVGQAWCLYLSYFLSMWNGRMYEFGAILFIQAAFPGNLLASSINGIAEAICVLLFSSALGRWVDRVPSRLYTLMLTVIVNRITVTVSCLIWFFLLFTTISVYKQILFAIILVLAMAEKSSRLTNTLSIERDWVPTLASTPGMPYDLTHLNTAVRRIDVLCKFLAPLTISTFISRSTSIKSAVIGVAIVSVSSIGLEWWCIQIVWRQNGQLRVLKKTDGQGNLTDTLDAQIPLDKGALSYPQVLTLFLSGTLSQARSLISSHVNGVRCYFRTPVWVPSICIAVMHASLITYSATFITYLLNAGFTLTTVTIAKAIGSLFEIGSTFVFIRAVGVLSKARTSNSYSMEDRYDTGTLDGLLESSKDDKTTGAEDLDSASIKSVGHISDASVARVGLWGICGLFLNLIPFMFSLFYLDSTMLPNPTQSSDSAASISPLTTHPLATILLLTFLSISLLCRWTYDLSATQLTQTLVLASSRSSFGGTEMAIVSGLSLSHWVAAAVWHAQEDFKWLALASFIAVGVAACCYGMWERRWAGKGDRQGAYAGIGKMEHHL